MTACPGNTADMHIPSESAFVPALTVKTGVRVVVKGRLFIVLGEQKDREREACEQVDLIKQAS